MYIYICVLDPYGRSPPFAPLGALGSGAFGGLGSPTLGQSCSISTVETRDVKDRMIFFKFVTIQSSHDILALEE